MALRRFLALAAVMVALAVAAMASPSQAAAACSTTTAINFGGAATASSIGAAGETDCYTFTGAAVDEVRIRVFETSGSLVTNTTVFRPNSTTVCTATTASEQTCSLDVAGGHRIEVKDNAGTNTGNYSIAIERLNNPPGCTALTFGDAPKTGSISASAEMDCFSFTGAVGDEIRIRTVKISGSLSAQQDVVRPDGTSVCSVSGAQELHCTIDAAGQHRVIVRDAGINTGDYAASVQRLNNPTSCTAISFGVAPTTASIAAAGEWDCYSFNGNAGDEIRIRLLETSGSITMQQEIISPDGTTACANTTASEVTCSLELSGQHRILVRDNNGTNTGNYSIAAQKLNSPTGCTALSFGAAPTTATIGAAAEADCYTFGSSPGRRVRIRVVKTSGTMTPVQEVVDGDGTTVCGPSGSQDMNCVLSGSATHRVFVDDSTGTNTGNYSIAIQRLDSPTGCTAIANAAAPTTATIGAAAEIDCYEFTGAPGDRFRVRLTETSGALIATQEVVRSNGSSVCTPTTAQEVTCVLGTSGLHRIIVEDNNGANTGNYSLAIRKLNADTGCSALTFGNAPTTANIAAADEMDCFTFSGTAGAPVRIRIVKTSGAFTPVAEVVQTNGATVCSASGSQDITCTPGAGGTHRVVVRDSTGTNLGDYVISVRRLNNDAGCTLLTYGAAPTAGSISAAGEMDCFRFAGAAGDQIRIRAFETTGSLIANAEVVRATGTTICGPTTASEGTCILDSSGSHRLILRDNNGPNTGDYLVMVQRLNNPTGCLALAYGAAPTTGSIASGEMDCFSFNGNAGDQIRVRMVKTAGVGTPVEEVVGPNGGTVCSPTGSQDVTCTLETTGAHTILVDDSVGTSTEDYAIGVQKLNSPTGCTALVYGAAPTAANIGAAGEMDCFSFTAAPGDRIRLRLLETSGSTIAVQEVVSPDGSTVCSPTTAVEVTCAIESSGQHRLVVHDNSGANTGNYSIAVQKLNSPTGCTALTFGAAPTATTIAAAAEMDCYAFAGAAGDRIRVRLVTTTGPLQAVQEIVRPSGNTVCPATGAIDSTCTLTAAGTHTIVVHDNTGTNTGNYTIAIQRLNNPIGCTALVIGAAATGASISANGETDCYTFALTAGQKITATVNETTGTLLATVEVIRVSGGTLAGPTTATTQAATAKGAGTYKVIVGDNSGTKTGNYTVRVTSP